MQPPESGQPHPEERPSFAKPTEQPSEQPSEQDQQRGNAPQYGNAPRYDAPPQYGNAPQYGAAQYDAPQYGGHGGPNYSGPPQYAGIAEHGSPAGYAPPGYGGYPPPPSSRRSPFGTALAVFALAGAGAGMFALPLNSYGRIPGSDVGFVQIRSSVSFIDGRSYRLYSELASFWWLWGAFIAFAALALLICVAVLARGARAVGWQLFVVALAAGAVHAFALAQSTDYRSGIVQLRGYSQSNSYHHAGAGLWVSLAGFALLAIAGLIIGLSRGGSNPS